MMAQGVCGSAGVLSENNAFTVSWLDFEGTNGSQAPITDAGVGSGGRTWSFNGNAQLTNSGPLAGTSSLLLDGSGDWIDTPDSADFNTGSSNFRIEARVQRAVNGVRHPICGQIASNGANATAANWLEINASNVLQAYVGPNAATLLTGSTAITDLAAHDVALERVGDRYDLYLDGVSDGNVTVSGAINDSAYKMAIGRLGEYASIYFNGRIDAFRFTNYGV